VQTRLTLIHPSIRFSHLVTTTSSGLDRLGFRLGILFDSIRTRDRLGSLRGTAEAATTAGHRQEAEEEERDRENHHQIDVEVGHTHAVNALMLMPEV
jgi:hypothetical protein